MSCVQGYLLYDVDHTCYEQINWYFPFLILTIAALVVCWVADCLERSTNILHSMLWWLSFCEDILMVILVGMYANGQVKGDRSLSMAAFMVHILLNLCFVVIHQKAIVPSSSLEYKQVEKDFKWTYWLCNSLAYIFNFKIALILIS